ncbi:MAG: N-acetylmuramoyl-L-alanine amidase [Acetatifactor sp.]|nr:N-acetylmuramoyl-L-alanine amidase [Acetatifactor sp.]
MKFCKAIPRILALFLISFLLPGVNASAAGRLQSTDGNPVIVIDPGHGGENLGTQEGGIWDEKYMNMVTAQALYDELSLYDNVEVYLTRTDDRDISFQERAAFAQSVNADFLFSIHYNASENHDLFGSEVWVPLSAPFNNYGYQIGYELLTDMRDRGLLVRGIKTRKGDRGEYYAIIRETVALDIPAAIIEHCHVDEDRDKGYCDSEEDLIQFGKNDATAIAKYFGLKSSVLNVDYSDYQLVDISDSAPIASTLRDETPPDVCQIEFSEADYDAGYLSFTVSAADYDSPLLYLQY